MKRTGRNKRPAAKPVRAPKRDLGPRRLRAMSKSDLIARVLQLENGHEPAEDDAAVAPPPQAPDSLIIEGSVRSGQTVEFPHGDVTVIGSVGSGAEIVAGGSIHVYGALRGRAVAGTSGNAKARIFCNSLQAELLSIDGRYRVAENFDPALRGRPVQAHLEGLTMALVPLEGGERLDEKSTPFKPRAGRLMNLISLGAERQPVLRALPR